MYWILSNELENFDSDADLSGDEPYTSHSGIEFDEGESIRDQRFPMLRFTMDKDTRRGRMTDHISITSFPGEIFSNKTVELLKVLNIENIELIDFEIYDPQQDKIYDDYKIANIIGVVDCVDFDRSDLKFYEDGDIKRIWKLVLNESKIPEEMKIFRLEKFKLLIVVHDDIKKAFEAAGITGCVFYRPEDYS